jgi:hypothetical protein
MVGSLRPTEAKVLRGEPLMREDFSRILHHYRDGSVVVLERESGRVKTLPPREAQRLGFTSPSRGTHR